MTNNLKTKSPTYVVDTPNLGGVHDINGGDTNVSSNLEKRRKK